MANTKSQIRIPEDLHAKLVAAATESGRSLNGEMLIRLEGSFSQSPDNARLEERMADLHQLLDLQARAIGAETRYSRSLAFYLKEIANRMREGGDERTNEAIRELRNFAVHVDNTGYVEDRGPEIDALRKEAQAFNSRER